MSLGDLMVRIGADISALQTGLNSASKQMKKFADDIRPTTDNFKEVGKVATVAAGAIAVGLGASVKTAADFEAQMSKVKALSGSTGEEFKALTKNAIDLGASSVFSASEAAAGMQNLAAAGFKANQITAAMPGILDTAAAAGEDFAAVSDIMISSMSGFGLQASNMTHIGDVLAGAANASSVSIAQIGESMNYVAPTAKQMGVSLEQASAAVAELGNAGIKGSVAGTSLNMMLTRLVPASDEAAKKMQELHLKFTDAAGKFLPLGKIIEQLREKTLGLSEAQRVNAIQTIFGTESMKAVLTLVDKGPAAFAKLADQLKKNIDVAKQTAQTMNDNLKGALSQLGGAAESAQISIGTALIPAIRAAAEAVTTAVNVFNKMPDSMKSAIAIGAAVTTAVVGIAGAAALLVGQLPAIIEGFGALEGVFAVITGPVGLTVAAIVGLGAAFVALYKANDEFRDTVTKAWIQIKAAALNTWDSIKIAVEVAVNTMKDIWARTGPSVVGIVSTVFTIISQTAQAFLTNLKNIINLVLSLFRGDWSAAWTSFKAIAHTTMDWFGNTVKNLGTIAANAITGMVSLVSTELKNKLIDALRAPAKYIHELGEKFYKLYDDVVGHSYVPDMVKGVGVEMAKLPKLMVPPTKEATKEAADQFKQMQLDIVKTVKEVPRLLAIAQNKKSVFGDSFDLAAEDARILETAITNLLDNGVSPASAKIKEWKDALAAARAEINMLAAAANKSSNVDDYGDAGLRPQKQADLKKQYEERLAAAEAYLNALLELDKKAKRELNLDWLKGEAKNPANTPTPPATSTSTNDQLDEIEKRAKKAANAIAGVGKEGVAAFVKLGAVSDEDGQKFVKVLESAAEAVPAVVDAAYKLGADPLADLAAIGGTLQFLIDLWDAAVEKATDFFNGLPQGYTHTVNVINDLNKGVAYGLAEVASKANVFGASFDSTKATLALYEGALNGLINQVATGKIRLDQALPTIQAYTAEWEKWKKLDEANQAFKRITDALNGFAESASSAIENLLSADKLDFTKFESEMKEGMREAILKATVQAVVEAAVMTAQMKAALSIMSMAISFALADGVIDGTDQALISAATGVVKAAADTATKNVEALSGPLKEAWGDAGKKSAEAYDTGFTSAGKKVLLDAKGKYDYTSTDQYAAWVQSHLNQAPTSPVEYVPEWLKAIGQARKAYKDTLAEIAMTNKVFGSTDWDMANDKLQAAKAQLETFVEQLANKPKKTIKKVQRQFDDAKATYQQMLDAFNAEDAIKKANDTAKSMAESLSSTLSDALGGKTFNLKKFEQSFRDQLKSALVSAITDAIIQTSVVGQLQPLLAKFSQALAAGDIAGAQGQISGILAAGQAIATSLEPLITGLRDALKGTATSNIIQFPVPALASGGVTTGPTLALIGERGPEAVVPLDQYRQGGGGGGDVIIQIYGNVTSEREAERMMEQAFRKFQRKTGARV